MDEDLEMLSDPCNGVTCHKESYASKLILQGMNKVNFRHLSVPMKYKIAYQERCNASCSMFETKKMHGIVFGIGTRGKISYYNQFFYTFLSLLRY